MAGPKSDFTIDIPAGNFITGTPLRLMAIVFNDGSSAGEDVAASKLKKIVEEALKIKGRRVEPATTVAHTTILNRPPLELVSVRNSRGPVDLGQKLQQDKEWFKGLTLDLRNTSSKTIISFDISLSLESTQGTTGPIVVPFYFGMHPLRKAKVADDIRIPSGESYSVSISENDYSRLTSFINRRADVNSIDRASIVFTSIMFNDETGWNMNNFVRIDPTSPSGLTLIKQD